MKFELSIIAEVDYQSNFSSRDSSQIRREGKLSDSDWDSRFGNSELGWYNMGAIQWTDLGRKYIIKRGKRSIKADFGVSISSHPKMLRTDYETYSEDN